MKKYTRELTISAASVIFGMMSIVFLLYRKGYFVPEITSRVILWFTVILFMTILVLHVIIFMTSEKRKKNQDVYTLDQRQKLFSYLHNECEFIPMESNMIDIEDICTADLKEENKNLKKSLHHIAEATNDGKSIFQQSINVMATKYLNK